MGRREQIPVVPPEGEIPLGLKIRARRWAQGLGLSEMARLVDNYDRSHLSHIETGKANPSDELLLRIATVLDISAEGLREASREQVVEWLDHGSPDAAAHRGGFRFGSG